MEGGTIVELTVSNAKGMHWNGTKQCTRCCGFAGYKRDGVGLTNSHLMEMRLDTWQYITPAGVTFPDVNTTGEKVRSSTCLSLSQHYQYCPGIARDQARCFFEWPWA